MEEIDIRSRLKKCNLKYIDSLKDFGYKVNPEDRVNFIRDYDDVIAFVTSGLVMIREQKDDMIRQLDRFKQYAETYPEDGKRVMTFLKGFIEFYANYARLMLIQVDLLTAVKYMYLADSDWDFRFFARRIYTLMYETKTFIHAQVKKNIMLNDLRHFGDSVMFDVFTEKRDALEEFLKDNKDKFKEVRNSGEAHKDYDIERQFKAIENLSVEDSCKMIDEFKEKLMDFYGALVDFHKSLEEYNNHLITIQGPGTIGIGGNLRIASIYGTPNGVALKLEVE